MAGIQILSTLLIASTVDILADTILQSAPSNGRITFQMQATDGSAAAHYVASLQLPGGDAPLQDVWVPAGAVAGLAGVLDDREMLSFQTNISQGGHAVFSVVLTGSAELLYRVIFQPG